VISDSLYQEMIVDHAKRPRNFGALDDATISLEGLNPLCGDQLTLHLRVVDGVLEGIAFDGSGCAISLASASLMTSALKGLSESEALAVFDRVHLMLTTHTEDENVLASLGKLAVLSGVWQYPSRVKCASLAWQTLRNALTGRDETARTE